MLIKIINKTHLKSNHYWLMAVIPKLKKLKTLKLCNNNTRYQFNEDGFKFLSKAISYFHENGGELQKLQFKSIFCRRSGEYLYPVLKCLPNIQVLNFRNNTLTNEDCKAIGRVLSDFKQIKELDLSNTAIQLSHSKEIADGLMRAKQLEIIKLRDNNQLDAVQIIYNLAFSPKINHIDLTNVEKANSAQTVEAIFKLLKISGSIHTLLLGGTTIASSLTKDFCVALGENKTLEHLNMDYPKTHNPNLPTSIAQLIGMGCAMNNRKNGSLTYLSMMRSMCSHGYLESFLEGFKVSDYDHEMWYGDAKVAREMTKE